MKNTESKNKRLRKTQRRRLNIKKIATTETFATTIDDLDNVLAFLKAITVKSPRVITATLSLHVDKCARVWF